MWPLSVGGVAGSLYTHRPALDHPPTHHHHTRLRSVCFGSTYTWRLLDPFLLSLPTHPPTSTHTCPSRVVFRSTCVFCVWVGGWDCHALSSFSPYPFHSPIGLSSLSAFSEFHPSTTAPTSQCERPPCIYTHPPTSLSIHLTRRLVARGSHTPSPVSLSPFIRGM